MGERGDALAEGRSRRSWSRSSADVDGGGAGGRPEGRGSPVTSRSSNAPSSAIPPTPSATTWCSLQEHPDPAAGRARAGTTSPTGDAQGRAAGSTAPPPPGRAVRCRPAAPGAGRARAGRGRRPARPPTPVTPAGGAAPGAPGGTGARGTAAGPPPAARPRCGTGRPRRQAARPPSSTATTPMCIGQPASSDCSIRRSDPLRRSNPAMHPGSSPGSGGGSAGRTASRSRTARPRARSRSRTPERPPPPRRPHAPA